MIIQRCEKIRTNDIQRFAWSRISQYQNVDHTTSVITALHNLQKRHVQNARQQAEQIKYCLSQAKEYFDAAAGVSLATRPVLLYYGAMSLALAEILLKQNGDSRLPKLREEHNCHGLQLITSSLPKPEDALATAANMLIAKPQTDSIGMGKGTFEVWRRSAREYPTAGFHMKIFPNYTTQTRFELIFLPADIPPPPIRSTGITLLTCLRNLPYMAGLLARLGCHLDMVRATVSKETDSGFDEKTTVKIIIHPNADNLIEEFGKLVRCPPASVNSIEVTEMPSGYILSETYSHDATTIESWPHSICLTDNEVFFACNSVNLGEFGFLYAALHICGNFARYYPDIWLRHIERSSPLSMAINELCDHAFERLPLLTLSEMHRTYYVLES